MNILLWLAQYNKAIASFLMTIVYFINQRYGLEIPIDDYTMQLIVSTIAGFIVWRIPNVPPVDTTKEEGNVETRT